MRYAQRSQCIEAPGWPGLVGCAHSGRMAPGCPLHNDATACPRSGTSGMRVAHVAASSWANTRPHMQRINRICCLAHPPLRYYMPSDMRASLTSPHPRLRSPPSFPCDHSRRPSPQRSIRRPTRRSARPFRTSMRHMRTRGQHTAHHIRDAPSACAHHLGRHGAAVWVTQGMAKPAVHVVD